MKNFHPLISISLAILALVSLSSLSPTRVAAADCGLTPGTPTKVSAVSGPGVGKVTLYWDTAVYAERYAVVYGLESNKYIYGSLNIGGEKARSFTVSYLSPGKTYHFRVVAKRNDCASSPFSAEVSAVASGGEGVTAVSVGAPVTMATPVVTMATPTVTTVVSGPVGKQNLTASTGPAVGEVTLAWQHADNADNYHLVYGTAPGKYLYGALNIGNITRFTVQKLVPGTTYYFALVPTMGGRALYTTSEVKAQAKLAIEVVEVVQTTPEALVTPAPPTVPAVGEPVITLPPVVTTAPQGQSVQGVMDVAPPVENQAPPVR